MYLKLSILAVLLALLPASTNANQALNDYNEVANVLECVQSQSASRIAIKCGKGFRVTWMNMQPYFSKSEGNGTQYKGIFKRVLDMLRLTCRYKCLVQEVINFDKSSSVIVQISKENSSGVVLHFDKEPVKSYTELTAEIEKESKQMTTIQYPRLFLPVAVTESYVTTVKGFPFIFYVDAKELLYVERKVKGDLMSLIWRGIMNSWELFLLVLLLASLFGMVVWLSERNFNRDCFPYEFSNGAAVGFWFTCVTMTTVGYGDKAPRTICGRITTLSWMLISLCLFPLLMANFTNLIQDGTVNSLYGVKVAVLKDGPEAICARKENADIKEYSTFKEALTALQTRETNGALLEKNSAIFLKRDIEDKGLRIARTFKCDLRMGIVAEPMFDVNNNKTVVNSIRNLRSMNTQCLTEKCREKMAGEAINKALLGAQTRVPKTTSFQSSIQLLLPLAITSGMVGAFILVGCAYDFLIKGGIKGRTPSQNLSNKSEDLEKSPKDKNQYRLSNVFTNFGRRSSSHEMVAK